MSASSVTMRTLSAALGGMLLLMVFVPRPSAAPVPPEPKPAAEEEAAESAGDTGGRNVRTSTNNLKQFGLAFHTYHDSFNALPTDIRSKDGKPLLSWRVEILPYLEHQALYNQFKRDEPWNSKHNLTLLEQMPKVFDSSRVKLKKKGYTVYQGFSGANALFRPGKPGLSLAAITDGTSNTILLTETSTAVPWTKPADIPFAMDKPVPDIGKAYGKRPLAVMADGSVRILDLGRVKPETLKHAINPADGNVLGDDW
jgi:Protein of unknown function (DUF1559)